MEFYYSEEKNVQIIIALLKANKIKKVIASPGATNICLVESMRYDGDFEMYSSVDERSAAYMACGMAAESGEPVVLTCTGATASRNYMPGLTEAYYRKLPIIAITATLHEGRLNQNYPQAIDRRIVPNDVSVMSVQLPFVKDEDDAWANNLKVNCAFMAMREHGGGPIHLNWETKCSTIFNVRELPQQRFIQKYSSGSELPIIHTDKVGIFIGSHQPIGEKLTKLIDRFCEIHNGAVFCDQTSNYRGKYRVLGNLITYQEARESPLASVPLLIYIGNVSGAYMQLFPGEVWRVGDDGESKDLFKKQTAIFEMKDAQFFDAYSKGEPGRTSFYEEWKIAYDNILNKIPELPFSNIWIAKTAKSALPPNCVFHLGILNSLRSWNFFETPKSVMCYSNTGGFGIDGGISSLIGASLVNKEKVYFGCFGDLAFFYDMNSIGNRHVGNNIRIMLINNGRGTEFRNYNHNGAIFGSEETDQFIAAAHHYGDQSRDLVKHYAEDLGFEYLTASNKEDFLLNKDYFFAPNRLDKAILFEIFTNSQDESDALKVMNTLESSPRGVAKKAIKGMLGDQGTRAVKKFLGH